MFASLCLLAAALLLEPAAVRVIQVAPDALGPAPARIVAGGWHGELYVPEGLWTMPVVHPQGHWRMPTMVPEALVPMPNVFAPGAGTIDVDQLVSGFKQLLTAPAA
ncbi:MAG: hypothetical protein ABI467_20370 [Kofleriaceae bacterium]